MPYKESFFKKTPGNKYGAKRTHYDGISYHSGREATFAAELDLRKKAGEITKWERQVKIEFNLYKDRKICDNPILTTKTGLELKKEGKEFNHLCNYYMDFVVYYPDETIEYCEVKGIKTDVWKLKWKLLEAATINHPNIVINVYK